MDASRNIYSRSSTRSAFKKPVFKKFSCWKCTSRFTPFGKDVDIISRDCQICSCNVQLWVDQSHWKVLVCHFRSFFRCALRASVLRLFAWGRILECVQTTSLLRFCPFISVVESTLTDSHRHSLILDSLIHILVVDDLGKSERRFKSHVSLIVILFRWLLFYSSDARRHMILDFPILVRAQFPWGIRSLKPFPTSDSHLCVQPQCDSMRFKVHDEFKV